VFAMSAAGRQSIEDHWGPAVVGLEPIAGGAPNILDHLLIQFLLPRVSQFLF